jgi:membrane protein
MRLTSKDFFAVFKSAFKEWWEKDPFRESAVIAYYAIFALPGLLVVIITVAGYFFGQEAVNGQIAGQITSTMGADTAKQIQDIIARATESKNSLWATIIGAITIWKVKADGTKSGILNLLKARLFSFGLIISIAFILIVSLVVSATLATLSTWIVHHFSNSLLIAVQIMNSILSLSILAALFALMFKIIPDAKIKWRHVWAGSFVTAILFEIGKFGLGLYFGKADPGSGYGAAGSIILILLWVSYSSMIVFYGAEFTHGYAKLKEGYIEPDENSIKIN